MAEFILECEGRKPITDPTHAQLEKRLRALRTTGPSSFAILTASGGSYLQVAGSPGGMLLEQRDSAGQHYRAFQPAPVVPFADGTELAFSAGRIPLRANEWFKLSQIVEILGRFLEEKPLPASVSWRNISGLLTEGSVG